jgi:hypothetical protein
MTEPIYINKLYKDITGEEKKSIGECFYICRHTNDAQGHPYFEYLIVYNSIPGIFIARFKEKEMAEEYVVWKNSES